MMAIKYVNGNPVEMTPQEEAAFLAEQEAEANRVPQSVTRRQAKQALRLAGKLALVQQAIDAIADPLQRGLMQDEWDESLQFERNRPSLIAMATAIGLSSADIDALFVQAATL